ncbi:MAG: lysine--tRNA ligase [Alphaproteobacteria bacterium]|jgi:lysyl-tRNA synthetase class 1|nr:lysine--tRNA ligase [Alphaproteobacteria bacterium]
MTKFKEVGLTSKAWPFEEARKLLQRINNKTPEKGYVLFETGYGPSGLPHIGTFGEVARTTMVMYAFNQISDIPTKLVAFSDDLDGFRKVPTNVPNQEELKNYLGLPLTKVKDPFGLYNSFGEHNNAKLQEFLDKFGFKYEFYSATKCYTSGMMDKALMQVLKHYDEIINVVLPTLGNERKETYSPFLPISPKSGKVLQTKVVSHSYEDGTITYIDEDGREATTKVIGGACKLQWKVDWAMRWYALEVDYEMSGKDLIPSVELSSKICKILGKQPPLSFTYELFLDDKGEKISKSKGNGLSIEEWLRYGNQESLAYYMYQKPRTAKRLYFDVIPKSIDEWLSSVIKYDTLELQAKAENPILFVHQDNPPQNLEEISFSLLLNLVSVINSDDKALIWQFINKYKVLNEETVKLVDEFLDYTINYYNDFVKPTISYKILNAEEKVLLTSLAEKLAELKEDTEGKDVQSVVYSIGKESGMELRDWFKLLYESLLGQSEGPRMGNFFVLYGLKNSVELINKAIAK